MIRAVHGSIGRPQSWWPRLALAAAIAWCAATTSHAQTTWYWSGNGTTIGGSGTWDTTTAHFGSETSAPFNHVWNNTTNAADIADFRTTVGTVTVQGGGISVGTINPIAASGTNSWVFTGGTITLGSALGVTTPGNQTNAKFENNIAIPNNVSFFYRGSGSTLNISGQLSGTGKVVNEPGNTSHTLTLTGNNSGWSGGMNIGASSGLNLVLGHNSALGTGLVEMGQINPVISATTPLTIANNFSYSAQGSLGTSRTVTLSGNHAMTFNGTLGLNGGSNPTNVGFTVTSSEVMTWNGAITQDSPTVFRSFLKRGAGTMVLGGANTYRGNTLVEAGTLLVNGTHTSVSTSSVNVSVGATLGGTGSIGGATAAIEGTLAPGLAGQLGTFSFAGNDVSFASGGSLLAQLNSNPAVFTSDLLAISGASSSLVLGGTSILDLVGPASFTTAGTYTLATFLSGSRTGEFTTVNYNGTPMLTPTAVGGVTANGQLVYNADSIQLVVVPEPTALALAAAGAALSGLVAWRRRRG
jgi:autotransporter-associated beta strand protein